MALADAVARPVRSHERFPCFDGVRALAALSVVVYHAVFFNTFFATRGGDFLGNLNAGVFIFFVTSGFLLYLPFAAAHAGAATDVGPRGYAIRRITRLYPAYWLVLAFFTFVVPKINIYGPTGFFLHTSLTQTYTRLNPFADGLPPAWSLVVEVSFYAFLPLYAALIGVLSRRHPSARVEFVGLAVLFALGVVAIVAIGYGYDAPWVLVLPQHIAMFALGMLLAVLKARRWSDRVEERLERVGRDAWVWWAGALVVFFALPIVFRVEPLAARSAVQAIGEKFSQMAIGFCIVVPVVLGPQSRGTIRKVLRSRVAVYLGVISYGIYLWHWYILRIVEDRLGWPLRHGNYLAVLALALPVVIVAASVSWFGLERPLLRIAHRVAPGSRRPKAPPAHERRALHDV
jgi:peptidoglycan/LPS O-acetylase OafA/YrhL